MNEVLGSGEKPFPIERSVPTFGSKARAATAAEMLPADFHGLQQTVREAENLAKAEGVRGLAYRENISKTLLKLSQYAVQLAEHDPRMALLVMKDVEKLDRIAAKRFRLDETGTENKASENLKLVSEAAEDGRLPFELE